MTSRVHHEQTTLKTPVSPQKLHLLLPASEGGSDLCKTLLTGAVLGYPIPTLIAWNKTHDDGKLLGGGSHVAKISGVLDYLESMDRADDNDLVMMMDAYGQSTCSGVVNTRPLTHLLIRYLVPAEARGPDR